MKYLAIAFGFLSILPVKTDDYRKGDIGRAAALYPFVGLIIGVIVGVVHVFLRGVFPTELNLAVTVALWAFLSGFLHLDGLSDCADALFYAGNPEKRIAILKDSRVGSFAVVTLILYFLIKSASLVSLPNDPIWTIFLISYASVLGRWIMIFIAHISQPIQSSTMGQEFKAGMKKSTLYLSLIVPVALALFGTYYFGPRILIAFIAVLLLGWAISAAARKRLGGFNGDVLGMSVELTELLCLLLFAIH